LALDHPAPDFRCQEIGAPQVDVEHLVIALDGRHGRLYQPLNMSGAGIVDESTDRPESGLDRIDCRNERCDITNVEFYRERLPAHANDQCDVTLISSPKVRG
jgi:hypothetical protein